MSNIFSKKSRSKYLSLLIVVLAFGYPISALIAIVFNLPSSIINASLRFFGLFLALVLLLSQLLGKRKIRLDLFSISILLFVIIYSIRLVYDISFRDMLYGELSSFKTYSLAFGNCLIPFIAILLCRHTLDLKQVIKFSFVTLILSNVSFIVIFLLQRGLSGLFSGRGVLTSSADLHVISSILVGNYGTLLFAMSTSLIALSKFKFRIPIIKRLAIFGLTISVINVLISASRGPFISLLILFVIGFVTFHYHLKWLSKDINKTMLIYSFVTVIALVSLLKLDLTQTSIYQRFVQVKRHESLGREAPRKEYYRTTWNSFLNNPYFGSGYLETSKGYNRYPHNIYLEVLMATGILGGVFFYLTFFTTIIRGIVFFLNRQIEFIFSVLFLTSCMACFTSGNLFGSSTFWILFAINVSIRI